MKIDSDPGLRRGSKSVSAKPDPVLFPAEEPRDIAPVAPDEHRRDKDGHREIRGTREKVPDVQWGNQRGQNCGE